MNTNKNLQQSILPLTAAPPRPPPPIPPRRATAAPPPPRPPPPIPPRRATAAPPPPRAQSQSLAQLLPPSGAEGLTLTSTITPPVELEEPIKAVVPQGPTLMNRLMGGMKQRFITAISTGNFPLMHDLVERGVDVNADTDGRGTTPLMLAILYAVRFKHRKSQMDVLDWLGQHWADPDIPDKNGMTPLMLACLKVSPEIVRILVEDGGADVNAVDENGMTALIYAMWAMTNSSQRSGYNTRKHLYKLNEAESYYRKRTHVNSDILYEKFHHKQSPHTKIVRFLCQHGADPNIIDKYGKKAIDYLRSSQYMTLRNILLEGCPPMKSTYTSTEGGYRRRSKTKRNHHRNKQTKRIARK